MTEPAPRVAEIPIGLLFEDARVRVELVPGEDPRGHVSHHDLPVRYTPSGNGRWGYLKADWEHAHSVHALVEDHIDTRAKTAHVHRIVAALAFERNLRGLVVHHRNVNPLDNRQTPEHPNLEPMDPEEHRAWHAEHPQHPLTHPGLFPVLSLRVVFKDRPGADTLARTPDGPATWRALDDPQPRNRRSSLRSAFPRKAPHTGKHLLLGFDEAGDAAPDDQPDGARHDGPPVRRARQLARFGLAGPAASWAALALRVVASHEGATRRRAIEEVFMARGGATRTLSDLLRRLVRAGLLERTKRGRYVLGAEAGV